MAARTAPLTVALIGRTNVGKSTLFNRFAEKRLALVSPKPGTTRDRREMTISWQKKTFTLVDTGGVEAPTAKRRKTSQDPWEPLVTEQTELALKEADLLILVVSAEDGVLPQDEEWAVSLRGKKPTLLVVNKVDNQTRERDLAEFYALGLGDPLPVSAISGRGSGDVLDVIVRRLKKIPARKDNKKPIPSSDLSLAIVGQPNSGKSSLLNALLGEKRVVVSPTAHTTREPIDTYLRYKEKTICLIDTAGIRRKAHVTVGVEAQGVDASLKTVDRADAVLLVIDVMRTPTLQDQRLADYIVSRGKAIVIVANKWDLVPSKEANTIREVELIVRDRLPGLKWAPIVFVSAKNGQRVTQTIDAAQAALVARGMELSEDTLKEFLARMVKRHKPIRGAGVRHPQVLAFRQVATNPPRFEVAVRGELHPSYLKFLENRLREEFGFVGTPMSIDLKAKKKKLGK